MIDTRRLADNLTDAMVRLLHFQEKGEPDWANLTYAAARDLCNDVPQSLIDRYRNEILFHNQVQRAVSTVLQLVQEAERATHQPTAAPRCTRCGDSGWLYEGDPMRGSYSEEPCGCHRARHFVARDCDAGARQRPDDHTDA